MPETVFVSVIILNGTLSWSPNYLYWLITDLFTNRNNQQKALKSHTAKLIKYPFRKLMTKNSYELTRNVKWNIMM